MPSIDTIEAKVNLLAKMAETKGNKGITQPPNAPDVFNMPSAVSSSSSVYNSPKELAAEIVDLITKSNVSGKSETQKQKRVAHSDNNDNAILPAHP
ncbi:hypothetical protein LTR66_007679 [Elasticomyces elasticus]|nr:hypothetical protein LTR66_007679 [Elasticomyces elasticus]